MVNCAFTSSSCQESHSSSSFAAVVSGTRQLARPYVDGLVGRLEISVHTWNEMIVQSSQSRFLWGLVHGSCSGRGRHAHSDS